MSKCVLTIRKKKSSLLITLLIVFILFPCIFGSLLDNKASGALPFFQRQFWSCLKVFTLNAVRQR